MVRTDDPTDELSAAWGIKEQLRRLLATGALARAWGGRMRMGCFAQIANMPGATKLYDAVATWGNANEVLIGAGATTAQVEAANTGLMNIKRTGRGSERRAGCLHVLSHAAKVVGSGVCGGQAMQTTPPLGDEALVVVDGLRSALR